MFIVFFSFFQYYNNIISSLKQWPLGSGERIRVNGPFANLIFNRISVELYSLLEMYVLKIF